MASIPSWQSSVVFTGKASDLLALVNQASKPYPSIHWIQTPIGRTDVLYKKSIVWNTPMFSFWNFDHPSNADIYKYFDKPNKKVWQRKWNREHWGSAYETQGVRYFQVATPEEIQDAWSNGKISRIAANAHSSEHLAVIAKTEPDKEMSVAFYCWTEDKPSVIWQTIASQHPNVSGVVRMLGDYYYYSRWEIADGVATEVVNTASIDTHALQVDAYGECRCVDYPDREYYWPQECRDRIHAERLATQPTSQDEIVEELMKDLVLELTSNGKE